MRIKAEEFDRRLINEVLTFEGKQISIYLNLNNYNNNYHIFKLI